MPPRAAANAAPVARQDVPWALGVLGNPDADPTQLPLALNYLSTFNVANSLPHDAAVAAQLLTLVVPFVCATDAAVNGAAIKVITRLIFLEPQNHKELEEALCQQACLQALWAVLAYFHASFDAYAARLIVIQSEPPEPPTPVRPGKPDSRLSKNPPQPPVDPETTLPGPSKYALDVAITALTAIVTNNPAAEEAVVGVMCSDVTPLLTVLRHHSSRVQVLALRLMRALLSSDALAVVISAAGTMGRLTELLSGSPFGAVREEVLLVVARLTATYPPAMQLTLDAGLPTVLLKHVLAPTTGVPQDEPSPPPQQAPGTEAPVPSPVPPSPRPPVASPRPGATTDGSEPVPEVPQGPPPIDFSRPMASSADRLQELSVQILLQLCKHHHGAVHHLLRLGAMQLLLALLPAPKLPEVTQQPTRRPSSASDTFIAHALGRGRASQTGSVSAAPAAPKDAWMQYIDGPPTLPLPTAPLNSHALTANLLQTLSCMLAEPGVQDYWWSVHSTLRPHLQLMYLLRTDAPPKPKAPEQAVPSRRLAGAVAAAAAAAAAAPPPPAPPPDLKVPPFPEEVRTAALQCVLQLVKDPRWLQLAPYLTLLQQTVRQTEDWGPSMVAPLAEILQRIMQRRLPPPARATTGLASLSSPSISPSSPPSLTGDNGPLLPSSAQPQQKRVSGTERPPPLASPLPALTADGTPLPSPSPLHSQRMCNAIPNGLDQAANGLSDVELSSEDAVKALKDLAKMERKGNSDPWATAAVAAALLVLPESAIYAPPWPPLPSPPPTPPPPPLPTSQYLWDALGRPVMTDGIKLAHL